jgi:hypothetical protein
VTTYFQVRDFARLQHYRDRNPPWIKLYFELLNDYEFACLHDASKWHLCGIMLLATRHNNRLPHNAEWVRRRIDASDPVDLDALISSGFLEICDSASTLLASRKHSAMPETETETETDPLKPPKGGGSPVGKRGRPATHANADSPDGEAAEPDGFVAWWKAYPPGPRKVAKSKCRREWQRRGLERIAEMVIAALRRSKASRDWTKQGGQFVPLPMTWLNRTPWETEPAEMAEQAPDGAQDESSNGFHGRTPTPEELRMAFGEEAP